MPQSNRLQNKGQNLKTQVRFFYYLLSGPSVNDFCKTTKPTSTKQSIYREKLLSLLKNQLARKAVESSLDGVDSIFFKS